MEANPTSILTDVRDRRMFREWLERYHATEAECWIEVRRGRPTDEDVFWYLDAVEEALCFGWVDSIHKEIGGVRLQRFTPRKPRSAWTELNKERDPETYEKALASLIARTKRGEMYGEWNDYGRLLDY